MQREHIIIAVLVTCLVFSVHQWFREWLNKMILAVWMVEKQYTPPSMEDRKRIAKWVIKHIFIP